MLVLTGTTGNLGSRVLHCLLSQNIISPTDLRISSSSPGKVAQSARDAGIEILQGDFANPSSLLQSFKGADALFLMSFPSPSVERWLHHRAAIDAAKDSGIKTVIYTSLMFGGKTGMQSIAGVQQAHIKTVEYLQKSGLQWVIIREGIYAESWWLYSGFQSKTFQKDDTNPIECIIPIDGPVAWVGWDDLAEGTAKILSNYHKYIGQTLSLTGPRALTIIEVSKLIEKETNRKVEVKIVGKAEAARYHKANKSVPEDRFWIVDSWSGWHDGIAQGEAATVDPLLGLLLGRQPKGIEDLASELFRPR